jgi:hypothetical protein
VPQIVDSYRPLWQVKWVLALGVAAEGVFYVLTLTNVMGNWWFVLATSLVVLVLPLFGRLADPGAFAPLAARRGASEEPFTLSPRVPEVRVAAEGVADARS